MMDFIIMVLEKAIRIIEPSIPLARGQSHASAGLSSEARAGQGSPGPPGADPEAGMMGPKADSGSGASAVVTTGGGNVSLCRSLDGEPLENRPTTPAITRAAAPKIAGRLWEGCFSKYSVTFPVGRFGILSFRLKEALSPSSSSSRLSSSYEPGYRMSTGSRSPAHDKSTSSGGVSGRESSASPSGESTGTSSKESSSSPLSKSVGPTGFSSRNSSGISGSITAPYSTGTSGFSGSSVSVGSGGGDVGGGANVL